MAPLIAAFLAIGLLTVPFIHSAGTSLSAIPLFDPGNYTATDLATSTLNDGIPDVWKTWYGMSVIDSTVANADYTASGIMNAEKFQLNIYPLAPADPPTSVTRTKAADKTKALATVAKGDSIASGSLLADGEFDDKTITFPHKMGNGYKNKGFQWGQGPVAGWQAVNGKDIEVWHTDADGKQFVELNASKTSNGIQQGIEIEKFHEGPYVLAWKDMAREASVKLANGSHYTVHVYAKTVADNHGIEVGGGQEITRNPTVADYAGAADWTQEVVTFNLTKDDLKNYKKIWIAFILRDQNLTYGALIDNVVLQPVDIDFVFGFGPNDERTTLENALSGLSPVSKDISNVQSIFVIKGNPQGYNDSGVKDLRLWTIRVSSSRNTLKSALSTTPYVVFSGHSNMGLGPLFVDVAAVTSTSSFLNIGDPQTAINVAYMMENEKMAGLKVPDVDIPASVNNYWVLPNLLGANGVERFDNFDNKTPPKALPFVPKAGKSRQYGYHFNRASDNEFLIVDVPAAKRAKDLPKLGYQTFFYNACNTVRDYSEIFQANKGSKFIASNIEVSAEWDQANPPQSQSNFVFAKKLMAGESWLVILNSLNKEQKRLDDGDNAYQILNF